MGKAAPLTDGRLGRQVIVKAIVLGISQRARRAIVARSDFLLVKNAIEFVDQPQARVERVQIGQDTLLFDLPPAGTRAKDNVLLAASPDACQFG